MNTRVNIEHPEMSYIRDINSVSKLYRVLREPEIDPLCSQGLIEKFFYCGDFQVIHAFEVTKRAN